MLRIAILPLIVALAVVAPPASAQSLNVDFGERANRPTDGYGAAGRHGVWNALRGDHGTTTFGLLDLDGNVTGVSLRQIGGLDTPTVSDPATGGDHALLMDDYLVTFNAGLESCIFFEGLVPGDYEVLVYARMPIQTDVLSFTSVDQEPGIPHHEVGGVWPGQHQELVSFSRHQAAVGADGQLQLHAGIVPGADPADGAALNGLQLIRLPLFADGFETGDLSAWDGVLP